MKKFIAGWTNSQGIHRTGCGIAKSGTTGLALKKCGGYPAHRPTERSPQSLLWRYPPN
jgi:hypothetical protein